MSIELETVSKLIQDGAYDDAIAQAKVYLNEGRGVADELEFLAIRALAGKRLISEAVARLILLTQKNPLQESYYHYLGDLFMRMDLWDKAFEAYGSAIELNPQDASFFGSLAECCRARKDTDAAFAAYERALQLTEEKKSAQESAVEFTKPFIAAGDTIILLLTGVGNVDDYALVGVSEDKNTGVYIPVGYKCDYPLDDDLKNPTHPLFSLNKVGVDTISVDRLCDSLLAQDKARVTLFEKSVLEYAVYRKSEV